MKKPLTIIIIVAVIIGIASFGIYKFINGYDVAIELSKKVVKVNMYDEIDLNSYIVKAIDSTGRNLTDKIKISVDCDEEDVYSGDTLYIKGTGIKEITYSVNNFWKTFSNSVVITVITDPNDPDFSPNYDRINEESTINNVDSPSQGGNTNLTNKQLDYLNSL